MADQGPDMTAKKKATKKKATKKKADAPKLLSGGNPQIAKADGDAPVQAYIAALPEWKHEVGQRLDALITKTVPGVAKAVRWNTPFYGVPGQGWFMGYHALNKYMKVSFFAGSSLEPEPPVGSKDPNTRYLHIGPGFDVDEAQLVRWIEQAAALPGWMGF